MADLWFTECVWQQHRAHHHGGCHQGVSDSDGRQPAERHHGGARWQALVHRDPSQQHRAHHHRRASSPSFRFRRRTARLPASRRGPMARSGSPRSTGNKIGRITTTGVITEFAIPTAEQRALWHHGGARWQRSGLRRMQRQQDRAHHHGGRYHRVRDSDGEQPACRHHGGARWQPLVHRGLLATRSGASPGGVSSREFAAPDGRAAVQRDHARAPMATSGSPRSQWQQDRAHHPAGVITEFAIPDSQPAASDHAGPDGNLWFTEFIGNNIGQLR